MADSSLIIDSDNITTFTNDTVNDADEVNSTITEVTESFDAMLETATGHYHDGTDSRSIASGVNGLTIEEYAWVNIIGGDL